MCFYVGTTSKVSERTERKWILNVLTSSGNYNIAGEVEALNGFWSDIGHVEMLPAAVTTHKNKNTYHFLPSHNI